MSWSWLVCCLFSSSDTRLSEDLEVMPACVDDTMSKVQDDVQHKEGLERNNGNEEMMTQVYDLEPVTSSAKTARSKEERQALDVTPARVLDEEMMTQTYDLEPVTKHAKSSENKEESEVLAAAICEVDQCDSDSRKRRSSEAVASQSSNVATTQVFDLADSGRSQSQADSAATQTFPLNPPRSDSQTDLLATQVFNALSPSCQNSSGFVCSKSSPSDIQAGPSTLRTTQQKSDGSPGLNCQTDLLPTQMFCDPTTGSTTQRSEFSPQQATQTFAAPDLPRRTSNVDKDGTRLSVDKDGSRVSFSPQSCSTQVFPPETNFPHLTLEMSECSESHEESLTVKPAAACASVHQVYLVYLVSSLSVYTRYIQVYLVYLDRYSLSVYTRYIWYILIVLCLYTYTTYIWYILIVLALYTYTRYILCILIDVLSLHCVYVCKYMSSLHDG